MNTASSNATSYLSNIPLFSNPFANRQPAAASTTTVVSIPADTASQESHAPVPPTSLADEAQVNSNGTVEIPQVEIKIPGLDKIPAQYRFWVVIVLSVVLGSAGGVSGYFAHAQSDDKPAIAPLVSSIVLNIISVATGIFGVYRKNQANQANIQNKNMASLNLLERAQPHQPDAINRGSTQFQSHA